MAQAATLARDLINTPSNDMGPEELAQSARELADQYGATYSCIIGEDLLKQNFPLIYAVGMASSRAPRLIDITWGNASDPKITLVGKGVCFDSGGLDIKPSSGMRIMKKDMGGAAHALALADLILGARLPVHCDLLIIRRLLKFPRRLGIREFHDHHLVARPFAFEHDRVLVGGEQLTPKILEHAEEARLIAIIARALGEF